LARPQSSRCGPFVFPFFPHNPPLRLPLTGVNHPIPPFTQFIGAFCHVLPGLAFRPFRATPFSFSPFPGFDFFLFLSVQRLVDWEVYASAVGFARPPSSVFFRSSAARATAPTFSSLFQIPCLHPFMSLKASQSALLTPRLFLSCPTQHPRSFSLSIPLSG